MNSRQMLIVSVVVVLTGIMLWVVRDRSSVAIAPTANVRVAPAAASPTVPVPAVVAASPMSAPHAKTAPMVRVDGAGDVKYVARVGDTLSQLAIAMLGSDSKEHRDAVVGANVSLQLHPDHVEAGQTYSLPLSSVQSGDDVNPNRNPVSVSSAPVPAAAADPITEQPQVKTAPAEKAAAGAASPKLEYIARPGDTVSGLASDLLGGDTKANRDGIVASNASLQQDPDHLVAGQSYTIVARNGLAADSAGTAPKAPTTQPDADAAVLMGAARALRYTAKSGDTVSKLAIVLLGSDSPANRELIIKNNPGLKKDPDHLVAGQTYWIAAPVADAIK